ncbi:MAG: hypothetical protein GY771_07085 [bacterium]|nr:hypothetical protein [bacterium]
MVKKNNYGTSLIAVVNCALLLLIIGCGDGKDTDAPASEADGGGNVEETAIKDIIEPVLPVRIPEEEYRGREVFIDEETGYEYVIEELDPGNPPLVIMANDFLDDYDKWDVIADFNDIPDARKIPDFTPLKVPIGMSPDYATISELRNQVIMKRITDADWIAAKLRIKLTNGDGVRTLDNSDVTISFGSGSKMDVGENSMVFISDLVRPDKGEPNRSNLNLEEGTLTITRERGSPVEKIEVTTTDALIKPLVTPVGEVSFRTKTTRNGSTLVMSYRGYVEVSAAGESVTLKAGEGSEIEKGETPSPPKPLLPAPEISGVKFAAYYYGNPVLNWESVDGASSYIVEIAYDRDFSKVIKIAKMLTDTKIQNDFPKGKYYWRVCATDNEGFDGYWSIVSQFEIVIEGHDTETPNTTFEFVNNTPFDRDGLKYLPYGCGIKFTATDDLSGIKVINIAIDGGSEKRYSGVLYPGEGEHEIRYYAVDRRGRKEKPKILSFIIDAKPPTMKVKASL